MPRQDPYGNFRFRVELGSATAAGFSDVSIGALTTDVISYREGTDPLHVRKLPGLNRSGNVTLKRGITLSPDLWDWYQQIATGQLVRRDVVIVLQDLTGADVLRFVVRDAWPMKYEAGPLNAQGTDIAIETLELANEGIERVQ
jgi:phage tail-like protein